MRADTHGAVAAQARAPLLVPTPARIDAQQTLVDVGIEVVSAQGVPNAVAVHRAGDVAVDALCGIFTGKEGGGDIG